MKKLISLTLRFVPRRYLQYFSHYILRFVSLFMRGNNVECPICEIKYRKFLPYGRLNPRPNALCPDSLSLERHRLMWLYLKERTSFFNAPHKLLHIAPELCFIDRFKSMENLDYTTADLESPLADVKMDVHDIPFEDNTFDVVFCNHVMEHVEDDIKAMSEIYRVLKKGGWAIIQSPQDYSRSTTLEDPNITDPKEREKVYWQADHVRLYGLDYGQRLQKAGFTVKEDRFVMELPNEMVRRYALPANEIIYFCAKN
ncbi:class I SAM-dependent methyltransferase [Roseivirga sp. UBA1976]|uniref:class I SAM-dependent methyltransferase n=1 Tax=Roseivirga sp. UBA1976 TaxID=1947386 RepID=UPI00257E9EC7|nr:class I SAM-dependent methyltransferase [Roseivirga sp. UBA1976]